MIDIGGNTTMMIQQLLSEQLRNLIFTVTSSLSLFIAIGGVVANCFNCLVFYRMGLNASINLSFFCLSVADLVIEVLFACLSVIRKDISREIDLGVDLSDVLYSLGPIIIGASTFSFCVTAVINAERCCCVALPLKVKQIFTVKITFALIFGMLVFQTAIVTVVLAPLGFSVVWSPVQNRPQIVLDQSTFNQRLSSILFFWAGGFLNFISCSVIVMSTIFMANTLRQRKKLLHCSTSQQERSAVRDSRLIRSVINISIIYITCFIPNWFLFLASFAYPPFQVFDRYLGNVAQATLSSTEISQTVSSAVNIFVYFKMNSKYSKCLRSLFKRSSE